MSALARSIFSAAAKRVLTYLVVGRLYQEPPPPPPPPPPPEKEPPPLPLELGLEVILLDVLVIMLLIEFIMDIELNELPVVQVGSFVSYHSGGLTASEAKCFAKTDVTPRANANARLR